MITQLTPRLERWAAATMLPMDDGDGESARGTCPALPEWLWQTESETGEEEVWEET